MSTTDQAKHLKSFLKSLRDRYGKPERPEAGEDPIDEFVWSFLLWESTTSKAENALKRIHSAVIDFNELRVSLPNEIEAMLGERYPLVRERAMRLRAALDDIYRREHAVSLLSLTTMGKREAKQRLDSIEGVPPFVSARVMLLALGGHAFPVDQRTLDLLIEHEVAEPGTDVDAASASLTRHVKASDALDAHLLIQFWTEDLAERRSRKKRTTRKKASTSKKKTAKRKATTKKKPSTRKKSTRSKKKRVKG